MAELPINNSISDNKLKFESFLIAFCDGVNRARKIINILSITSIAALLGLFNSLKTEWNWFPSRQARIREMYPLTAFENDSPAARKIYFINPATKQITDSELNVFTQQEFKTHLLNQYHVAIMNDTSVKYGNRKSKWRDSGQIAGLLLESDVKPWIRFKFPDYVLQADTVEPKKMLLYRKELINGYNMLCLSGFSSRNELDKTVQAITRARMENVFFVRIPILGIAFDVNWLVIISGAGFLIIYFLLYYAFSREKKNIKLLFNIAGKEGVSDVGIYQYMSMQQVFTIPYSIDEILDDDKQNDQLVDKWPNKIKRIMPRITWAIPLLTWLVIFWYDWISQSFGLVINKELLQTQFMVSILIGIALVYLTYLCLWESILIDRLWKKQAIKIFEARRPQPEKDDNDKPEG